MHRKCTGGQVNHIRKKNDDSPTKSCVKSWCKSSDLNFRPSVLNGLFDMFKRQNVNCVIDRWKVWNVSVLSTTFSSSSGLYFEEIRYVGYKV